VGLDPTRPTSPEAQAATATFTPISRPSPQDGTDVVGSTGTFTHPPRSFGEGPESPPLIPLPSLSVASTRASARPPSGGSIGPQMRSFRASARARIAGRPVTAFAIVGFVVAAASALAVVQSVRRPAAVSGARTSATDRLPIAEPFEVAPAPTIATPAFDEIAPSHPPPALSVAGLSVAALVPSPSATSSASAPEAGAGPVPYPAPISSGKKDKKDQRPRVTPARGPLAERPGPGF